MKQHRFLPAILLLAAALMFAVAAHAATPRSTKGALIQLQAAITATFVLQRNHSSDL